MGSPSSGGEQDLNLKYEKAGKLWPRRVHDGLQSERSTSLDPGLVRGVAGQSEATPAAPDAVPGRLSLASRAIDRTGLLGLTGLDVLVCYPCRSRSVFEEEALTP